MSKVISVLKNIFGYGVVITLFAGALAPVGYVIAMFIGGEAAASLCSFIFKQYYPVVIQITAVCIGCGLVVLYLDKKTWKAK